jgi:hypothetical protein
MATAGSETQNLRPYYNVLPKDMMGGPLVNAGLDNSSSLVSSGGFPSRKTIIISISVIAVVALLGFIVYGLLGNNDTAIEPVQEVPKEGLVQIEQTPEEQLEDQNSVVGVSTTSIWQKQYFKNETCGDVAICGDDSDPDRDGLKNLQEFNEQTDPNNPDSDSDQIADGDEINIFSLDPLKFRTAGDPLYSDTDYVKGGYDSASGQKFTADQLAQIKQKITQDGLHQPTVGMLGDIAQGLYGFGSAGSVDLRGVQSSQNNQQSSSSDPEGKLNRDIQRQETVKKIGSALLKYKAERGSFPEVTNFDEMYAKVKPYNLIATNPKDPVNKAPYVYIYEPVDRAQDFIITYLSETQNQPIKYKASDAQRDTAIASSSASDEQRITDLETLRSALLIYSSANVAGSREYIFPTINDYKTAIVPKYLSSIPKDPKTGADYDYQVSANFDSFTLKAVLENTSTGTTGYLCNQEECRNY